VNGTPSLFINGLRYDGERDVDSLVSALRQAARDAIRPRAATHR
jgi:protein-disulfide isomerase